MRQVCIKVGSSLTLGTIPDHVIWIFSAQLLTTSLPEPRVEVERGLRGKHGKAIFRVGGISQLFGVLLEFLPGLRWMVRIESSFLKAVGAIEQHRRLASERQTVLDIAHSRGLEICRDIIIDIDDRALGNVVIQSNQTIVLRQGAGHPVRDVCSVRWIASRDLSQ